MRQKETVVKKIKNKTMSKTVVRNIWGSEKSKVRLRIVQKGRAEFFNIVI